MSQKEKKKKNSLPNTCKVMTTIIWEFEELLYGTFMIQMGEDQLL